MGLLKKSLAYVVALALWSSSAAAVTITDGYVGGDPTHAGDYGQDVIGTWSSYDISHMTVDVNNGVLTVAIFSKYFDHVGRSGTQMGDLFISTDGWTPFGAAPYPDDTILNGTSWELALVLDNHGSGVADTENGQSFVGQSGVLTAYAVNAAQIQQSYLDPNQGFRANQAAQYLPGQQQSLAQGSWSILPDDPNGYAELLLTINLGQAFNDVNGIGLGWGFHWTQSCANDVIEGQSNIPEPATIALFGAGLVGLLVRRKRA